jgi:ppGpp synthetase/RelA/SpoT-type nucleotidyltranferase
MSNLSMVDNCLDMIGQLSNTMQQHDSLKRYCMELWYNIEDQKIADREAAHKHKVEQSEATCKHKVDRRVKKQASLTLQLELAQVNIEMQKLNVEMQRMRMRCLELSAVAGDVLST